MTPRGRLFRKYVIVFAGLVSGALLVSGLTEIYFSYRENRDALVALQREKALGVASRIEGFIKEIERQIGWTTQPQLGAPSAAMYQRRVDYLRLLRQALMITEISHLDGAGLPVAHPDSSLVRQKTSFAGLEQVKSALAGAPVPGESREQVTIARDLKGGRVMTVYATIAPLKWSVFVEQPLGEAFETLYASIQRTIGLLVLGVLLAVAASLFLARRMVTPIQALRVGAARIGAGELDQRIDVRTGDELEALGDQFNSMAAQLKESYAGLERKVEARTRELTQSLEQQTAMGEILRVISSSPTDLQPVMDAVAENAARVCGANDAIIWRIDGDGLRRVAPFGALRTGLPDLISIGRGAPPGRSVDELQALGEVGRAVSSTLDVETVLHTIVSRASQLAGADGCTIYEYDRDAEEFRMRAAHNYDADFVAVIRAVRLRKGEGVMG